MPKLLLFTPCLKAIAGDDGLLTIVSILEFVGVNSPSGETFEENSIVRLPWQMVSVWYKEAGDEKKKFEQTLEFLLPSGQSVYSNAYPLNLVERTTKIRIDGDTFPVGLPGEVIVQVGLREAGSTDTRIVAEYPVLVRHNS
ncbi:hypothetical protein CCAX7_004670 [Capsulimonas corticalis]|uniref:Uncharacterized protein n=1 Tax=Capsulimonas corticalis TaxID=2219043 RepID=A0A402D2X7_9BACT|nr:hypothetical protein [Capsulimonas corticalis]BDI28416.1 hypothetical protein CCAX7_004670 [Capsulimonas corticalis]